MSIRDTNRLMQNFLHISFMSVQSVIRNPHSSTPSFQEVQQQLFPSFLQAFFPFGHHQPPPTIIVFEMFLQLPFKKSAEKGLLYISNVISFSQFSSSSAVFRCFVDPRIHPSRLSTFCFFQALKKLLSKAPVVSVKSTVIVHSVASICCRIIDLRRPVLLTRCVQCPPINSRNYMYPPRNMRCRHLC